jgi:hypothetical protein
MYETKKQLPSELKQLVVKILEDFYRILCLVYIRLFELFTKLCHLY